MRILKQTLTTQINSDGGHGMIKKAFNRLSALSEFFWFLLTFLLFVVLGPFSAIAVLFGLGSLAHEGKRNGMTEPASI